MYPDYIGHPVTGMSWCGALKYCNWLTLDSGRGEDERCYTEGSHSSSWRPVHLTEEEWNDGMSDFERMEWLSYRGFRLPMDHRTERANYYNEFYKAAAWNGSVNTVYGFGRNTMDGADANYWDSGDPFEYFAVGTSPVGFFDGTTQGGVFSTRVNENYYGICDLTGNVEEWTSDCLFQSPVVHVVRGGCWLSDSESCENSKRVPEEADDPGTQTTSYTGFRVVTTAME